MMASNFVFKPMLLHPHRLHANYDRLFHNLE